MTNLLPQRNGQRDRPDPHHQQSQPAPADGHELGCDARLLFRTGRQPLRRLVPQDDQGLHRQRHQHRARSARGTDNGFNGEYGGFTLLTSSNAGTAIVQGWEFSYQQQFTFLPGLLKGLSGSANYTMHRHARRFRRHGQSQHRTRSPGFIPRAANVSLVLALPRLQHARCSTITPATTS